MISELSDGILLTGDTAFDPQRTFTCGQCFRFDPAPDGSWQGISAGKSIRIAACPEGLRLTCSRQNFRSYWQRFLGLDLDLNRVAEKVGADPFLRAAFAYGKGIRLLRQEPFECLISFILSQCNNIPRIKGIVGQLCACFGEPVGSAGFAFPTPDRLAALTESDLASVKCGFRAKYVLHAARAVASGELDLAELSALPTREVESKLMQLEGVGRKVADCVLLFSLGKGDAFPRDVWMNRILAYFYPDGFDAAVYGDDAGLIQQYLFCYGRDHPELFKSSPQQKMITE